MRYYSVRINHSFEKQPHHLVGKEAYLPKQAHLLITSDNSKTIEGVAVLIDVPQKNSEEEIEFMMARVPYLPQTTKTPNAVIDPPVKVVAHLVGVVTEHQPVWDKVSIKEMDSTPFMHTILSFQRRHPDLDNPQPNCRKHLVSMFKNHRTITQEMQSDAASVVEAHNVEGLPETIQLGKVFVTSTRFPTITNAQAAEILRRYNRDREQPMTGLRAECISDRDTLWTLRRFFDQTENPVSQKQGWLIELDFNPEDDFSMKVVNDFLLPKLAQMAEGTLVILTTDSIRVAKRLEHPEIIMISERN